MKVKRNRGDASPVRQVRPPTTQHWRSSQLERHAFMPAVALRRFEVGKRSSICVSGSPPPVHPVSGSMRGRQRSAKRSRHVPSCARTARLTATGTGSMIATASGGKALEWLGPDLRLSLAAGAPTSRQIPTGWRPGPGPRSRPGRHAALPLTGMRRIFSFAASVFGRVTVSTPFLKLASALSRSTPFGRPMRRSKRP